MRDGWPFLGLCSPHQSFIGLRGALESRTQHQSSGNDFNDFRTFLFASFFLLVFIRSASHCLIFFLVSFYLCAFVLRKRVESIGSKHCRGGGRNTGPRKPARISSLILFLVWVVGHTWAWGCFGIYRGIGRTGGKRERDRQKESQQAGEEWDRRQKGKARGGGGGFHHHSSVESLSLCS
jgi:hypothetical protein